MDVLVKAENETSIMDVNIGHTFQYEERFYLKLSKADNGNVEVFDFSDNRKGNLPAAHMCFNRKAQLVIYKEMGR